MTYLRMGAKGIPAGVTRFMAKPALAGREITMVEANPRMEVATWMLNAVWSGQARSQWKARGGK